MNDVVSHPKYRPDIDGLRAIAVLSVVLFHAFPSSLKGGFAGVDVFFVISGFLISTILFQNIDRGTFSIADFYSRRIRRIFPALSLVLLSVLVFGWFCLFPDEFRQLGKHTAASAGFVQNFILWRESGYFDNASDMKPLLHIWSLGIEEQFYFVWPLLLSLAGKFRKERHRQLLYLSIMCLVFIGSFLLNVNSVKANPVKTFYLPHYRFWELATGGILAWVVLYKPNIGINFKVTKLISEPPARLRANTVEALALAGLVILFTVFIKFDKTTTFPGFSALLPVLATSLIIFAGPESFLNKRILSNKVLVWFGLISYPLYLWHWPILSFGRVIYGEEPAKIFVISACIVSVMLSWLTVKFVESPFRFVTDGKNEKVIFLLIFVFAVGGSGFGIQTSDGVLGREKLLIHRWKGAEEIIGMSDRWFKGKGDWLFLGNAFDKTVSKMRLSVTPSETDIASAKDIFERLASICSPYGAKVVLFLGPDKPSIYPEYLPDELKPSEQKYIDFYLNALKDVPNLTVYNPTADLIAAKETLGYLYFTTDTHWNNKGAFVAFRGFAKAIGVPYPNVQFQRGRAFSGDLINISGLQNFPLSSDDNWEILWPSQVEVTETAIPDEKQTPFGPTVIVSNKNALSSKRVWIVGDSFINALRPYFNSTFKEVRYLGHWEDHLKSLVQDFLRTNEKPDLIVVQRVERTF